MKTFSIEKTIAIDAPVHIIFEALTNSNLIVRYYPLEEVISNWKIGSEIVCKGSIEGQSFTDYGKIDSLTPNEEFQYTYWSTNHGTKRTPENCLTICYTLLQADNGTNLKLKQKNIKSE